MRELDYGKIGKRIRQVRQTKGWSQNDLAKRCGISMSFLGHIERGTRIMSLDTFVNICEAVGARADELLWGVPCSSDTVQNMGDTAEKKQGKEADSYSMYIRIMKSVAEIMNEV